MSVERINRAIDAGILPEGDIRASLGKVGMCKVDQFFAADAPLRSHTGLELIKIVNAEKAFSDAEKIYGIQPPSLEAFAMASPDAVGRLIEVYENEFIPKPEIIVARYLTKRQTTELFAAKTRATTPNNPLRRQTDGDGLWINPNITDTAWDAMNTPPSDRATVEAADGVTWSLAAISGVDTPEHLGKSYQDVRQLQVSLPTISEYLTLQLARIENGESPLDGRTWTWLQGQLGSSQAPVGYWEPGLGQVYVGLCGVGGRNADLGARGAA